MTAASVGDALASLREGSGVAVVSFDEQGMEVLLRHLGSDRVVDRIPEGSHVFPVDVDRVPDSQLGHYSELIERSLDHQGVVVLMGRAERLAAVKPDWVQAWPGGDTVVLNGRWGLRIDAIQGRQAREPTVIAAVVDAQMQRVEAAIPAFDPLELDTGRAPTVQRRFAGDFDRRVDFSIRPATPTETCTAYGNEIVRALPVPVTPETWAALMVQLRRHCQAGTLASLRPDELMQPLGKWRRDHRIFLNLDVEWALIRSVDLLVPAQSRAYFWVKSLAEGAGDGFTRDARWTARKLYDNLLDLADVAIHTGWGRSRTGPQAGWSYPVPPAYWPPNETDLFACDLRASNDECPLNLALVRLFPTDSFDESVTISKGTSLAFSGAISGSTGSGISLELGVTRTQTETALASYAVTSVASSASRAYSRTTRWRPNVPALWAKLKGSGDGAFGSITPLAATLNPRYDALWMFPLEGNIARPFTFGIVFEAGLNYCAGHACAGLDPPFNPLLRTQARGLWLREIELALSE